MRGGRLYLVKQEQLVPGDVIYLSAGDIVPCDARLIEADELKVLEVNLTSVTHASLKKPEYIDFRDINPSQQLNMVFASTIVTMGTGKAITCLTGEDTLVCKMEKNSPIVTHENLKVIGILKKYCSVWSLCMIGLIFVLTTLDFIFGIASRTLFDIFLTGLTLAVASMSEFYMAFGYIIIACGIFNAVKKYKDVNSGAMIKNTSKLEVLKDLTCLVVPKEGAFSIKDMRIERIFTNNNIYSTYDPKFIENCSQVIKYAVISTGIYGSSALIANNETNDNIYTPEEDVIIQTAEKFGLYNIELDNNYPIIEHMPLSDNSLFETTLVKFEGTYVVAIRGEVNKVLENCKYYCENGRIFPLDNEKLTDIKITVSLISREAYRVVGVASKTTIHTTLNRLESCQTDLTFEGFMAIREPMLEGAAKNVSKCQAAGLKIIMLCEDVNINNRRLAEAVGIAHNSTDIINTYELAHIKDGLFRANIPIYRVYEGLTIAQKRLLIQYLRDDKEVVGVLGRELDEIILLSECDVGFAQSITVSMKAGKGGVDLTSRRIPVQTKNSKYVAKGGCEALKFKADVIVSEAEKQGRGGFNAIIEAIACSKVIYKNLIRMIKYLLTVQSARLIIILYSILTRDLTFTPIQILFSGLIIDFMAVIIIAFEKPSRDILSQKEDTENRLQKPLSHNIQSIVFGLFWAALAVVSRRILYNFDITETMGELISFSFVSFLVTQIMVLIQSKKEKSIFIPNIKINGMFFIVILFMAGFITAGILFTEIGVLFGVVKMNLMTWGIIVLLPLCMLIIFEIYKFIVKIKRK